jgi:hypothetical protein
VSLTQYRTPTAGRRRYRPLESCIILVGCQRWYPPPRPRQSSEEHLADHQDCYSPIPFVSCSRPITPTFTVCVPTQGRAEADTTGIIYLCLVTIPLMFGSPPFNRPELFSYQWPKGTLSLSYVGLGEYRNGSQRRRVAYTARRRQSERGSSRCSVSRPDL